jgi:uncharacterized damage-inducible protein DinB
LAGVVNFDLADSLAVLERTPGVLRALLAGLPEDWTGNNEGPDTWSPFDVVGHLIDGEETDWMARARTILEQGPNRRFAPFDRTRHLRNNKGKRLSELLDRFSELRERNLRELRALDLTEAHTRLTGEHPDFGSVTLEQLLATWVVHDLEHLAQIARVMAKHYGDAVGPWRAYLPLLDR